MTINIGSIQPVVALIIGILILLNFELRGGNLPDRDRCPGIVASAYPLTWFFFPHVQPVYLYADGD